MNIEEVYTAQSLIAYYQTLKSSDDQHYKFIGEAMFPSLKRKGLKLSWVLGSKNVPAVLKPSAFDVKAPIRDRISVRSVETEMPFFKESMTFTEQERQDLSDQLREHGELGPVVMGIMQKTYIDYANLVAGADVQTERMRMSLLSTGTIKIASNNKDGHNIAMDYVYDSDGSWAAENNKILAGTDTWITANNATSNPIDDLENAIADHRVNNGVITSILLMNTTTFRALANSLSVQKAIKPAGGHITNKAFQEYIKDATSAELIINDNIYLDENGDNQKYYPDGYVSLLPSYSLGFTNYGTTPTEYDLLNKPNSGLLSVGILGDGVAVATKLDSDPVTVQTIVSQIALPSFEGMKSVYVIKVS